MADGDGTTPDVTPASGPTPGQEANINTELFGGQKPSDYLPPPPPTHEQTQNDYYLKQSAGKLTEDKQRAEEYRSQLEKAQQRLSEAEKTYAAQGRPALPQYQPYLQQSDLVSKQQNAGQMFGNILALVAIGSVVFGKRHGAYAQAIQMAGLGSFLKNFSEGRREVAQDQLHTWQQANEVIHKNNLEKLQTFKDIYADNRLRLSEQHELAADLARAQGNMRLAQAAENKDSAEVFKILGQQEKAIDASTKTSLQILNTIKKSYFTSPKVRNWVDEVRSKGIDPFSSPQALQEAAQKYPMSDWAKDAAKKQAEEEKPAEEEKGGGLPTYNVPQAQQQSVGTEFMSPGGVHYKVISQSPFQVQKVE